jgi:hypothetical protein
MGKARPYHSRVDFLGCGEPGGATQTRPEDTSCNKPDTTAQDRVRLSGLILSSVKTPVFLCLFPRVDWVELGGAVVHHGVAWPSLARLPQGLFCTNGTEMICSAAENQ